MMSYTQGVLPTIVNEFNTSYRVLGEIGAATSPTNFDRVTRDQVGLAGLGQLFPARKPPPDDSAGELWRRIPNAANIVRTNDRLPIDAGDERYIVLDNLSVTRGSHSFKFGFSSISGTTRPKARGHCLAAASRSTRMRTTR